MSQSLKERVSKSWKTTLMGLVLVAAAIISVFTSGSSWVDAVVPISLGLGFIFSKDEWINKVIKFVIIVSLVGCNPVKKVLNDKTKFDIVAEEVIRRGYCVNDTVTITDIKDSIVYKDSIIELEVPCKDFDTTIGRARIKVSSGVLTYSSKDSIRIRTKTVVNNIRDKSLENILRDDVYGKDSLINSINSDLLILRTANNDLTHGIAWMKFKLWLIIASALVVIFRKQLLGLLWRFLK